MINAIERERGCEQVAANQTAPATAALRYEPSLSESNRFLCATGKRVVLLGDSQFS